MLPFRGRAEPYSLADALLALQSIFKDALGALHSGFALGALHSGFALGARLLPLERCSGFTFGYPMGGGVENLKAIVYFGTQRLGEILMVIGVNVAKCHKK